MTRTALFGCGRIGTVHAASVTANPRAELGWVCDPMEGPAEDGPPPEPSFADGRGVRI